MSSVWLGSCDYSSNTSPTYFSKILTRSCSCLLSKDKIAEKSLDLVARDFSNSYAPRISLDHSSERSSCRCRVLKARIAVSLMYAFSLFLAIFRAVWRSRVAGGAERRY